MEKTIEGAKVKFPISVISDILGVHQRTLRIYDEQKLLSPSRSDKNRRLYSFEDIEKGNLIRFLTHDLGLNLIGVKLIFALLEEIKPVGIMPKDYIYAIIERYSIIDKDKIEQNKISSSKKGRKKK